MIKQHELSLCCGPHGTAHQVSHTEPAVEFSLSPLKHDKFQAIISFTCCSYNSRSILPRCRDLQDVLYKVKVLLPISDCLLVFVFKLSDYRLELPQNMYNFMSLFTGDAALLPIAPFVLILSARKGQCCLPKDGVMEEREAQEEQKAQLKQSSAAPFKLKHPVKVFLLLAG